VTREEAIKVIESSDLFWFRPTGEERVALDVAIEALSEPKTGEWILLDHQSTEEMENDNYYYFCSNCLHEDVHAKTQEVPYCWYCGAKMTKGGESE
jgi:hypothetical protein